MRILTSASLALVLTVALATLGSYVHSAAAQEADSVSIAVDTNSDGNSPDALGETDVCSELAVGEERTIDIVVREIPEVIEQVIENEPVGIFGGIEGFQFDIHYDEEYVIITGFDVSSQLLGLDPDSNVIDGLSDDVPSDGGLMKVVGVDFGARAAEAGDGVLARLTVRGVGAGTSDLQLTAVQVNGLANFEYTMDVVENGLLAVGVSCVEGATPPPPPVTPQPSPIPRIDGDETPAADGTDEPGEGDGETPEGADTSATPASNGTAADGNGESDGDGSGESDGDGSAWVIPVAIAIVIAIVAVSGGVYALRRRGSIS